MWDAEAATFDAAVDHGLGPPETRRAWQELLRQHMPTQPAQVLDAGCGTGSLSVLLAENGHSVTGIDFSEQMLGRARKKAADHGQTIEFQRMDAANPEFSAGMFEVVICRHVLWALKDPAAVLQRWARLIRPPGRMILIEGYWMTDAGLHAAEIIEIMPRSFRTTEVHNLSDQPLLWGKAVADERFVIVAVHNFPQNIIRDV